MRRVALTGGIGTGKSHVTARLREAGVPVVDADVLAREVVTPGTLGLQAIVTRFGDQILTADGTLDRAKLGAIVFADARARQDLEAITHPAVRARIEAFFDSLPADVPFAVADIPLLYEGGRADQFDAVVVVACDPQTQIRRVMTRDGFSREDAERRIAAQLPIAEKVRRADFVIHTDGSFEDTNRQVAELLKKL